MTISIKVSINGSYKVPVTTQYGDFVATTKVISGRGLDVPFVIDIPYYNNTDQVKITVGPESYDNGE